MFWKVSGIVAGFVVTVLCLSRRTVLHTVHARMLPACSNFAFSHLNQLDLLLAFQFLNAALLAIGLKAATCQKGAILASAVSS